MNTKHDSKCLKNADDNEPIFVLRGQDETAPAIVRHWISKNAARLGSDHPKIKGAESIAKAMAQWPKRKLPD